MASCGRKQHDPSTPSSTEKTQDSEEKRFRMNRSELAEINAAREHADSLLTDEERSAREEQHKAALNTDLNAECARKEAELAEQITTQNAKNAAAQKERDKTAAERRIAENAANSDYRYKPHDPNAVDPLLELEPEYVQKQFNYVPLAKRPKPVAPVIAKAPAPVNDPLKRPMPELAKRDLPLFGVDLKNAELQVKPTPAYSGPMRQCDTCHQAVAANKLYHMRGDVKCPVDIAACVREGIITADSVKPTAKNKRR